MSPVEMAASQDLEASAGRAAGLLGDLQAHALESDGVVALNGATFFVTEDGLEIGCSHWSEARQRVGGSTGELVVVGGQEAIDEVTVGTRRRTDPGGMQFFHQAILQGA